MRLRRRPSWSARRLVLRPRPGGRWQTGRLTPADLDAAARAIQSAGLPEPRRSYGQVAGPVTTMALRWGERRTARASALDRGVARGAYPEALARTRDAMLAIQPVVVRPQVPSAVRVAWRPRPPRRAGLPGIAGALPVGLRSGRPIMIGTAAERAWTPVGQRSYRGAVAVGRPGYLLAVEPVLG